MSIAILSFMIGYIAGSYMMHRIMKKDIIIHKIVRLTKKEAEEILESEEAIQKLKKELDL